MPGEILCPPDRKVCKHKAENDKIISTDIPFDPNDPGASLIHSEKEFKQQQQQQQQQEQQQKEK